MIGVGYNLMQCYTILILSQALLSLITSYSLGEKRHTIASTYALVVMPKAPWNIAIQDSSSTLRLLVKEMAVSNFNE
jgi:hypothetical protein